MDNRILKAQQTEVCNLNDQNIAYIVLCHDEPKLLRSVAKALDFGNDRLFVHVDKKSDITPFVNVTSDLKNVTLIKNRVEIYWGGFNSIIATMDLLREVLNSDVCYNRIVLLQGKDYPLHSPQYIHSFFNERTSEEFCKGKNITISGKPGDYMKCCGYWALDGANTIRHRLWKSFFGLLNTKLKIKYRKGFFSADGKRWDIYKGWAQVALTRSCAEYVLRVYDEKPKYNKFMKHRFPPDEIYIHTILYNSPFKNKISTFQLTPREGYAWFSEQLNLTYFEYPDNVTVFSQPDDFNELLKTNALFFRKVKYNDSIQLINYIEKNINLEK